LALVFGASQVAVMTLFHGEESKPVEIAGVRKHILALHRLPSDRLAALPVVSGSAGPGSSIRTFLGPRGAPHRLSVFYCLTSSDCRQLHATLKVLLARHPGELRVDVRFFPLWHGCNAGFDKRRGGQPNACSLARNALAVALSKPEAFADYLDWLFENQHEMTETNAVRQAQSLVEAARWQAAIDDLSLWQRLRQDTELARKLDVLDVPQVFLEVGQAYGGVNVGNLDMLLAEVFGWKSVAREGDDKESVWVARDLLAGHVKRAAAHVKIGRYADAVQELRTAMRIKTDWSEAAAELARILAICPDDKIRNGPDALYFARLAHETTKESSTPVMMEVLAAALAENGRFSEAVAAQRKAMELYKSAGADHQSEAARQRMEMFIQGRPYRLPN
jgi:tetratricopeptide (TPR) repeat protein